MTEKDIAQRVAMIDEAGRLEEEIGDKAKRLKNLEKEFRAWTEADKVDAGSPALYQGETYSVTLGKRDSQRRITSLYTVYRRVGIKRFVAACSMTLKALEELLGKEAAASCVVEERTGSRDITIARIVQPT